MMVVTRAAKRSDLSILTALYAQLIGETASNSFGDLQVVADWSFNDAFVADLIDNPSRGIVQIAEVDGVIAAMAIAYRQSQPTEMPCVRSKKILYLESIHVDPKYRRRGLSKKLIQAVENYAYEQAYDELELEVYVTNSNARRLYESVGFIPAKQRWRKTVRRV